MILLLVMNWQLMAIHLSVEIEIDMVVALPFIPRLHPNNLKLKRKNIMLGLLYRPPRDDLSVLSALESTLEELSTAKLESLVILWDFNIDHSLSKITSAGSRQLGSMSDKFGLKHIVCLPTRVSEHSCSIIDHIYLSENLVMLSCEIQPPIKSSDHHSIFFNLEIAFPSSRVVRRKVLLYNKADFVAAYNTLRAFPTALFSDNNVGNFWVKWYDIFMITMVNCIPFL